MSQVMPPDWWDKCLPVWAGDDVQCLRSAPVQYFSSSVQWSPAPDL